MTSRGGWAYDLGDRIAADGDFFGAGPILPGGADDVECGIARVRTERTDVPRKREKKPRRPGKETPKQKRETPKRKRKPSASKNKGLSRITP